MNFLQFRFGFTLIEIITVTALIAILVSVGGISYHLITRNSRDSTRRTHLQQIGEALEMYKSNNTFGSYPNGLDLLTTSTPKSLESLPLDPKTQTSYSFTPSPASCSPTDPVNVCKSYTLCATLEKDSQSYCIGPFGQLL